MSVQLMKDLKSLKTLGANVDESGYIFATLLIRKLPAKIRENINRAANKNFWELEDLPNAIANEIDHLKFVEPDESKCNKDQVNSV